MKQVYDTLMQIRATSSTKEKLAILMTQQGNEQLKEFLRVTYEPRINFYIAKVDPEFSAGKKAVRSFDLELVKEVVDALSARFITGNAARRWLADLYHDLEHDYEKELLVLMINRDVKCGFSDSTILKVWPGLVTKIPYMRCSLPKEVKMDEIDWAGGVYSQLKSDGMFANVSHHAGIPGASPFFNQPYVTIESRNGSPFPLEYFANIVNLVKRAIPVGQQAHGELLMKKNGVIMNRAKGNGMFNKILQGGEPEEGCVPVYVVWDMIPIAKAKIKNKYNVTYISRFTKLKQALANEHAEADLRIVETKVVYSYREAIEHYKGMLKRKLEGTVLKLFDAIWEDATSKGQIKFKLDVDVELKIVGFNPADDTSKNKDLFGSLKCESADGKLVVGATGIKDEMRKYIWENRENLIGSVVTILSNGLQEPDEEGGLYSLFLPRFVELRKDKSEADDLARIILQIESKIEAI